MKSTIFAALFLFTHLAFASGPTQDQAMEISKKFYGFLASPKVSGVGIGFCDSMGVKLTDFNQPKNICVLIQVLDVSTESAFKQIFPVGTMIDGTFVSVEIQGFGRPH